MSDTTVPSPRFRTVQVRVPVLSAGLVAGIVAALLVAGAAAWGVTHVYHERAAARQARIEADAAGRELSARVGAQLAAAEEGIQALGQAIDKGIAADASDDVDVNGYLDRQGKLRSAVTQAESDASAFAATPQGRLLAPARHNEIDALGRRADGDTAQLGALDGKIQQAAQHRQKLAQAEQAARAKRAAAATAAAKAAKAAAASSEASSTPPPPPSSPAYYDAYPYYYSGYPYYGYPGYWGPGVWIGGSWGGHGHGGWHGGGGHHHR